VAASDGGARVPDPQQARARAALTAFVEQHPAQVFFSRQLEVLHEDTYFHWVTNRAVRELVEEGVLHHERRPLRTGGTIHLLWHRSYRFYRRSASRVVALVEAYAQPAITEALGLHGELMALEWSGGAPADAHPRIAELDAKIRQWPRHPGNDPYKEGLERLAEALRPLLPCGLFAIGYNEFCAPSVPEALEQLIRKGARRILVIPSMATPGGVHSERDIPNALEQVQREHPGIRLEYVWPFDLKQVAELLAAHIRRLL